MTTLHQKRNRDDEITLSIPIIRDELNRIDADIKLAQSKEQIIYLSACYQALRWALCPNGYAAPTESSWPSKR